MTEALRRHARTLAFLLLCSVGTICCAVQMWHWGDALSEADTFSEANTLRSVDGFRDLGLGRFAGLGNVLYGLRYPDVGFTSTAISRAESVLPTGVYPHYPPGPEYLLYLDEMLFGPEPVVALRILPLAVGWVGAVFLGFSIRRRFGETVGWLTMLACAALGPFSDANSSIHQLGYSMALLLVEIGIVVGRNRLLLPFALLGFAQGWLSFDRVFQVALAPLAIELAMSLMPGGQQRRPRLALLRCGLAGGGFAFAHVLHFCEVWAYFGSFGQAFDNLHQAASFRAGVDQSWDPGGYLAGVIKLLIYYVVTPHPFSLLLSNPGLRHVENWDYFRFLGLTLGPWWSVVTFGLAVAARQRQRHGAVDASVLLARWLAVSGLGLGTSMLWVVIMQNHGWTNMYYLYRHLFFWFFLSVLFLSVAADQRLAGLQYPRWLAALPHPSARPGIARAP
jgi:hypothetical protein